MTSQFHVKLQHGCKISCTNSYLLAIAPWHAAMNRGVDFSMKSISVDQWKSWMVSMVQEPSWRGHNASSRFTVFFRKCPMAARADWEDLYSVLNTAKYFDFDKARRTPSFHDGMADLLLSWMTVLACILGFFSRPSIFLRICCSSFSLQFGPHRKSTLYTQNCRLQHEFSR